VKVAHAFHRIVTETLDETFMNSDGVHDESIAHRMSNRRKGTKGKDIRRNPDYNLDNEDYSREGLTIYWFTEAGAGVAAHDDDWDDDEEEVGDDFVEDRPAVYTIISAVVRVMDNIKQEHCKVYISKKIGAKDRAHVISRIRHFAG
jgi:hypothetical protein